MRSLRRIKHVNSHRITIRNEFVALFLALLGAILTRKCKLRDDLAEGGEGLVDVRSFLETLSGGTSRVGSFGTRQIDETTLFPVNARGPLQERKRT